MVDHTAFNDIHLAYRFKDTRIADIRTILHRLGHEGRLAQVPRRSALALARLAGAAMRKVSQFNSSLQTNATHLVPQLQLVAPHAASLGASVVYKDQGRRSSASILREAYSTVSTHGVHVRRDEQWRLFWVYVVDGGLRRLGEANPTDLYMFGWRGPRACAHASNSQKRQSSQFAGLSGTNQSCLLITAYPRAHVFRYPYRIRCHGFQGTS